MNTLSCDQLNAALRRVADVMEAHKTHLCELDAATGDGDHGLSMARGFRAVAAMLDEWNDEDIGKLLASVGITLVRSMGGATGPIFGTFFLRAGKSVEGKAAVGPGDLATSFEEGLAGVQALGKAEVGEKTVVDAMHPAARSLRESAERGLSLDEALRAAAVAAEQGAAATKEMVATKGRSRYQGERSKGHQDAGATSFALIVRALERFLRGDPED